MTMEATFEKLLVRLARAEIRFVVVGGIAVSLQGYVRLTEDVDILLDCEEGNVIRFLESLADYGEGFAREFTLEDFAPEEGALRLIEESEGCQLDIFTVMSGKSYADLAEDADIFKVQGFEVPYASKKSLIELKSNTVREKDLLDVQALKRLEEDQGAFD
jgi:predicted nucleotidyltransferase